MTIDQAKRILEDLELSDNLDLETDEKQAIKLGIEALKRCKVLAENSPLWRAKPLPGETEE